MGGGCAADDWTLREEERLSSGETSDRVGMDESADEVRDGTGGGRLSDCTSVGDGGVG